MLEMPSWVLIIMLITVITFRRKFNSFKCGKMYKNSNKKYTEDVITENTQRTSDLILDFFELLVSKCSEFNATIAKQIA